MPYDAVLELAGERLRESNLSHCEIVLRCLAIGLAWNPRTRALYFSVIVNGGQILNQGVSFQFEAVILTDALRSVLAAVLWILSISEAQYLLFALCIVFIALWIARAFRAC